MIGPDDIGERRPTSHTPSIALAVAATLLLVVGALSYRDFVRSSYEKEFAEKEERLMQHLGHAGAAPGQPGAERASAQASPRPAGTVLYDAQGNPVYLTEVAPGALPANGSPPPPAAREAEATLPTPEDPDIASLRESLDQAREQSRLTEQRYNQIAAGNAAASPTAPATGGGQAEITAELPDFLRNAVENPPGGNPEIEAQLRRMRSQVMAAPSLAKVTSYDSEWGIVTFDAGSGQGVKIEQRFAVRRGGDVLGWVKVNEVTADQAIATLVTRNANSEISLKPEVGDDLIDFELF